MKESSESVFNLNLYEDSDHNGDELRVTIADEAKNIIVIVWFNNLYKQWTQNRVNQETRGTLMNILKRRHPRVIYHEADMSTYNRDAYTYKELAKELGINIDELVYGPTVIVMHDQRGSALRSDKGTLALVTAADKEIHAFEKDIYGVTQQLCDVDYEIEAINQFKMHTPWENYEYYSPDKDEINHERHNSKSVAAKLINMNKYIDKMDQEKE